MARRQGNQRDSAAEFAGLCVQATLRVPVETTDRRDGQRAVDLRANYAGRTLAIEVKRVVDAALRESSVAASRLGYVRDERLRLSWHVSLEHRANWKDAAANLPRILLELEALNFPGGPPWHLASVEALLEEDLGRLRVGGLWPSPPTEKHPPGFYLMPEGWGAAVPGIEAIPDFLGSLLADDAMARLRAQLRAANADERHAFLWLGWENAEAWALDEPGEKLPATTPQLPEGIDAVWVGGTTVGARLIAWLPRRGWINGVVV
ncbi:hypothetical protein U2F26_34715 [Micromonospora sp. 4G57]|uniref:Uncharacterized protein n=1 Tax=Micromonospora sicca TaxID=2202420 RepID=A0ABU5JQ71_9ACTN|nr:MULTISPECIES: hypothetical protein [unclassified Micromonospora]MDZ5447797.1 hypothetical protein [Micromonospora sp. 4G57]MDZ5494523.1 hypothetical protein [Micromonospora sp. 4G53]